MASLGYLDPKASSTDIPTEADWARGHRLFNEMQRTFQDTVLRQKKTMYCKAVDECYAPTYTGTRQHPTLEKMDKWGGETILVAASHVLGVNV